jgi:hypothetical protein
VSDNVGGYTRTLDEPCRGCGSKTYPCGCVLCPKCDGIAREGELDHECIDCSWRGDDCESCGARMVFDPTARGVTCGGLELVGWMHCPKGCGKEDPSRGYLICNKSRSSEADGWRLAKSGVSLDAGRFRVRIEAGQHSRGDVAALAARLVRVPELEAEVERLRELLRRRGIATPVLP